MDELAHILATALTQLGVGAERIWPQVVAITFVKGLFWVVVEPLALAVAAVLIFRYLPGLAREVNCKAGGSEEGEEGGEFAFLGGMALGIGVMAIVYAILSDWPHELGRVLYPEGATVLDLTRRLR